MPEHGYVSGDPRAECDSCHFIVRRSQLRRRWDGFLVCVQRCWEPRPEAERPPKPRDREAVRNARPPQAQMSLADPTITNGREEPLTGGSDGDHGQPLTRS